MKLNSKLKSAFVQPFSCIALSTIAAIGLSPSVLAVSLHSPQQYTQRQVEKLAQFSDQGPSERSQILQQANALYNQGDMKGAEENLRKLIKQFPKDAFGHFQLGNVLFRQKKSEEAISAYREAIRLQSKYALAYNAIGMVYASENRWQEAITEYQKALEINPNYAEAMTNFALAMWQTNKQDEAISYLEKALNIFKEQNRKEKVNQVQKILEEIKKTDDPSIS
ncbi:MULTISPECIES: tetratricopeptide repeat protein [Nostoc]|uniref:Tetratricopeptide repeat protein n=1 Tax=Nostoc paludosum FACHB-159 TaxID=2692908 RepID=A0ABR8K271_9NOSO|nr:MULTISPECIES: tetratricopeptide repeat protein [Nostoc]MBD2676965.1 tetratricopeptide repeat protein [Nostoc sp. FACHB-857]MBD2733165.1 tetratricopeptide repeat protein [Nostoc paludosum FACHB-159]